jgi:hypothetical protein
VDFRSRLGTVEKKIISSSHRESNSEFAVVQLGTSATIWPIVPTTDDNECGAVGEMRIGRGNLSTRTISAPAPLCPPQILHDVTWDRTRAAAVGSGP